MLSMNPDTSEIGPNAQKQQTASAVVGQLPDVADDQAPALFTSSAQVADLKHEKNKKLLLAGAILVGVLFIAGGTFLAIKAQDKKPQTTPVQSNVKKDTPAKSAPAPAAVAPSTLGPVIYDNGVGSKFSVTFYSNAQTISGSVLPSTSTVRFSADNAKILEEQTPASGNYSLLLLITASSDPADAKTVQDNNAPAACGTDIFNVTLGGNPVQVCDYAQHAIYDMSYMENGKAYYVTLSNTAETDLTPRNDDIKKILSSIVPE